MYANEALFLAKIHPEQPVNKLSLEEYNILARSIKKVLKVAIYHGGTTLRDYVKEDGTPGSFKARLRVYGRANLPCFRCKTKLKEIRISNRSTVFCPQCQKLR